MDMLKLARFLVLEKCYPKPWEWPRRGSKKCMPEELSPYLGEAIESLIENNEVEVLDDDCCSSTSRLFTLSSKGGATWEYYSSPDWEKFSSSEISDNVCSVTACNLEILRMRTYYQVRFELLPELTAVTLVDRILDNAERRPVKPFLWKSPLEGFEVRFGLDGLRAHHVDGAEQFLKWRAAADEFLRWTSFGFSFKAFNPLVTTGGDLKHESACMWLELKRSNC